MISHFIKSRYHKVFSWPERPHRSRPSATSLNSSPSTIPQGSPLLGPSWCSSHTHTNCTSRALALHSLVWLNAPPWVQCVLLPYIFAEISLHQRDLPRAPSIPLFLLLDLHSLLFFSTEHLAPPDITYTYLFTKFLLHYEWEPWRQEQCLLYSLSFHQYLPHCRNPGVSIWMNMWWLCVYV